MDVSMPFMGGMEATELIRSYEMHKGLTPTPIIALTAHASAYIDTLYPFLHRLTVFFSDWRSREMFTGWNGEYRFLFVKKTRVNFLDPQDDHITSTLQLVKNLEYTLTAFS